MPFLVDNKQLGHRFRDHFLGGLRRLIKAGKLKVFNQTELDQIIDQLSDRDWVVFIQPPPKETTGPEQVLKYLARYMTGGPISDRRLIKMENGYVHFWARSSDKSRRQVEVKLPVIEFIRSWTLHILPKGFTKSRSFGGWSNTRRKVFLQLCLKLAPVPAEPQPTTDNAPPVESEASEEECRRCPKCNAEMKLESSTHRPSWRDLFYGVDHLHWFETLHTD